MSLPPTGSARYVRTASVLLSLSRGGERGSAADITGLPPGFELTSSEDGLNHLAYRCRDLVGDETPTDVRWLVLGDDFEFDEADSLHEPTGNATVLECGLEEGTLVATTSIPGLPALYLMETAGAVVVTSDLYLLTCVRGVSLRFDPAGVRDLAAVGRPVEYRTLFSGVRMMPGGCRLTIRRGGEVESRTVWTPPARNPLDSWDEYTRLQSEDFGRSMAKLDLRSCEFSLSSGLDSRATLAGVISNGATVAALTVSGEKQCLDARSAARLCDAYGLRHQTIKLNDGFRRNLPDLVTKASLLSGGISSVWHAAQVHCYQILGDPSPTNALSGYLGNQIGRRGTEGLTPRGAGLSLLNPDLVGDVEVEGRKWYAHAMHEDGFLETQFLIQQESTFGNLASYQVGNSHSIQQSAYAYRPLIENMWRLPTTEADTGSSSVAQNLKHLFLGEPLEQSFQRRFINGVGGLVASYPINWGWRSRGGVSVRGMWWGALTLADAVVSSRFPETALAKVSRVIGVAGLHEFRPVHEWMHQHMKAFVYDELLSRSSMESGLFDSATLTRALDDYYLDGRGSKEIALALDLVLAAHNFNATA